MPTVSGTPAHKFASAPTAISPQAEPMAWNQNSYNPGAPSYPPGAYPAAAGQGGYAAAATNYPPQSGPYGPHAPVAPPNQPPPGIPQDLWQWFQSVDADRSGKINAVELKAALLNGNYTTFNEGTCRLMIKLFDRDNSGTIDIHEFASLWKYISDWRACFDRFDQDRSGSISSAELSQALTSFGYRLSPQFCQNLVQTYAGRRGGKSTNPTAGGSISFDDFIEACVTIKNLTDTFRRYDQHQQGTVTIGFEQFLDMVVRSAVF